MNRYIDIDDLKACINILADKMTDGDAMAIKQAANIADSLPSIDIVRCKECKWGKPNREGDYDCRCHIPIFRVGADDFCSYGERKSDE